MKGLCAVTHTCLILSTRNLQAHKLQVLGEQQFFGFCYDLSDDYELLWIKTYSTKINSHIKQKFTITGCLVWNKITAYRIKSIIRALNEPIWAKLCAYRIWTYLKVKRARSNWILNEFEIWCTNLVYLANNSSLNYSNTEKVKFSSFNFIIIKIKKYNWLNAKRVGFTRTRLKLNTPLFKFDSFN